MINKCKRCGRPLKDSSKIYGPVCARKITDLSALDHLDPTDGEGEPGDGVICLDNCDPDNLFRRRGVN